MGGSGMLSTCVAAAGCSWVAAAGALPCAAAAIGAVQSAACAAVSAAAAATAPAPQLYNCALAAATVAGLATGPSAAPSGAGGITSTAAWSRSRAKPSAATFPAAAARDAAATSAGAGGATGGSGGPPTARVFVGMPLNPVAAGLGVAPSAPSVPKDPRVRKGGCGVVLALVLGDAPARLRPGPPMMSTPSVGT